MPLIINSNGKPQYFDHFILKLNNALNEMQYQSDQNKKMIDNLISDKSCNKAVGKVLDK